MCFITSLSLVDLGAVAVTLFVRGAGARDCSLQRSFFSTHLCPHSPLAELPVVIGAAPLYFKKLVRGLIYKIQICHTDNVDF